VQVDTDPYTLKEYLGSGAFSNVYKVEKGESQFVLKVFKSATHAETIRKREQKALMTLIDVSVPRFIENFDVRYSNGISLPGIVIQPVGKPIRPVREGEVIKMTLFTQVLKALEKAHSLEIAHMDVKPNNILLYADAISGESKLILSDWSSCLFIATENIPDKFGTIGYVDLSSTALGPYVLDLIALVKTFYSCLTSISPPSTEEAASLYWNSTFRVGTIWAKALNMAMELNYTELEEFIQSI